MAKATPVYLEVGSKRVFASSLDWPGWSRSGKNEDEALAALVTAAPRYAAVAEKAGVRFPAGAAKAFDVVERVKGSATTDFGAPGKSAPKADAEPLTPAQAKRLAGLLEASWWVFDRVVKGAPATLRKGPRGGGRDRDAIVEHVVSAEANYARTIGVRHQPPAPGDTEAVNALRRDIAEAIRAARDATPATDKGWPPRYVVRRMAWHVLDHSWEIEDRRDPEG